MKIEVDVARYHDWELRPESEVGPDDVAIPSNFGAGLRHVQVTHAKPNTVHVIVPDSDIDRMVEDHREAVDVARHGYTATHEGGALHGQEVTVAPRNVPNRSRRALLADHLAVAVLPHHAPSEHVTRVRIVDSSLAPDEQASLERYLNRKLTETDEDDIPDEPAPSAAAEEEAP